LLSSIQKSPPKRQPAGFPPQGNEPTAQIEIEKETKRKKKNERREGRKEGRKKDIRAESKPEGIKVRLQEPREDQTT